MILAWAVVLGLLVAWARYRGEIADHLASLSLTGVWLVPLALLLQLPLLRSGTGPIEPLRTAQILFLASQGFLLLFVGLNRGSAGIRLFGLGLLANLLVIGLNSGFMPITPDTLAAINPGSRVEQWIPGLHYGGSKDIILPRGETVLWLLSDILILPPPFPWTAAFSVGDLLIGAGIVWFLQTPGTDRDTVGGG